jgi:hypothetical protein
VRPRDYAYETLHASIAVSVRTRNPTLRLKLNRLIAGASRSPLTATIRAYKPIGIGCYGFLISDPLLLLLLLLVPDATWVNSAPKRKIIAE